MSMGTSALGFSLAPVGFAPSATRIIPNRPRSEAGPTYDPATVIDVRGTVSAVWEVPAYLPLEGLRLAVKSGWETVDVYVGPTDFVKLFGVTFVKGDKIEVIGSKVMSSWPLNCAKGMRPWFAWQRRRAVLEGRNRVDLTDFSQPGCFSRAKSQRAGNAETVCGLLGPSINIEEVRP